MPRLQPMNISDEHIEQAAILNASESTGDFIAGAHWALGQAHGIGTGAAPAELPICRTDGRCQYAIDHGAEGLGHCPKGKCAMPAEPVGSAAPAETGHMPHHGNAEDMWIEHEKNACPHCGGSGHKDDVRPIAPAEAAPQPDPAASKSHDVARDAGGGVVEALNAEWLARIREKAAEVRNNSLALEKFDFVANEARFRALAALYLEEVAQHFERMKKLDETRAALRSLGGEQP